MNVLSLCDHTGVMVQPWLDAGANCVIVDLQHPEGSHVDGRLMRVGGDIFDVFDTIPTGGFDIVFAFPPCTNLAVSGARWFKSKGLGALIEALTLVECCREICETIGAPWMIENPISTLSTYWRKPDFMFDPCDFGDPYTKRTCLWIGNGFVLPEKRPVEPTEGSKMHRLAPGPQRAALRSATPLGFAQAVFDANYPILAEAA